MKIGILTLPLYNNYGGILQAYALQKHLQKQGHDTWIIKKYHPKLGTPKKVLSVIKRSILSILLRKDIAIFPEKVMDQENILITEFITKNLNPQTKKLHSTSDLASLNSEGFDFMIVGSDQVWREKYYSEWKNNFFFDFVDKTKTKCISYAASFGVDFWEYPEDKTAEMKQLIGEFSAISVREDSAVELCKSTLGLNAEHHVDPSMLLDISEYKALIDTSEKPLGSLMTYNIEESSTSLAIINTISKINNYNESDINQQSLLFHKGVRPTVSHWLKGFNDAHFIVTDSFHGCIFSILFNKPFFCILNKHGGSTRIRSLLKMFNIESRLIEDGTEITEELINEPINWKEVNAILENQRNRTNDYFNKILK